MMERRRIRVGPSTIQIGRYVLLALLFAFPVPVAADGQCAGGFGADNYLHTGTAPTDLLSDFPQGTVEFCVFLEQHANPPAHVNNTCVGKRDAGNGFPPLTIHVRPDGRIFANWYTVPVASDSRDITSESLIDLNEWVHVAFTWDGTFWRVYINGVQDAALADPSGLRQATDRVWLGDDPWGPDFTLKGRLDNVRISNIARQPGDFGTTLDVNTVALWLLDGNGLDETGAYDLIEVGSMSWSQSCFCGAVIPTVSEWGVVAMTLLLMTAGTIVFARRGKPSLG